MCFGLGLFLFDTYVAISSREASQLGLNLPRQILLVLAVVAAFVLLIGEI